jgi:riboflavin kinase/FMN adenylyltransferase
VPIIRDLNQLPDSARRGAVAIGNFDGVHRGHLEIVKRLLERARDVGGPGIVFTFDPHPVRLLRPEQCPPPLTWTERKAELLAAHGVYMVVAYPTDEELLQLSAKQFFDQIVLGALEARAMVEGPNFYFGHNREGNVEVLGQLTKAAGITLDVVPPVEVGGEIVSSSRIRALISAGDVATAGQLLSAPYRIRGMVTHGAGRGGKIGFPTANLQGIDTLLPKPGVYAGRACVQSILYPAAINLGPNPTFGESALKVEIHLLDYHDSLYGQPLEVEFLARLRDIAPFSGVDALVAQLQQDVQRTREIAASGIAVE